ncbi:MAG: hypothetical protein IPL28_25615 [Chloroflexi bacterium]|nr:hypothetical protein [Chloroflexota bacterium]
MKTGYKTTEFWLTAVVNLAVVLGILTQPEASEALQLVMGATAAIVSAAYIFGRAAVKVKTAVQEQGVTEFIVESVALDYDGESLAELGAFLRDLWSENPAQDADDWAKIVQTLFSAGAR